MDVSTLLKMLQLLFPPPLRGASNCQDIDIGSCHSDYGTKERGNDFILILHYCKQEVLKHLDATLLDFILLFSEFDDERFNPINFLYALGSLAFKQGNVECLENVQSVVIENYHDSPDASFLMNDLGVMLSLKAMYERSEECFSKAKKLFQQEEDHLKNAVVTLNLAALYMILGEYKKACEFCNDAADLCHGFTMRSTKDIDLPMKVLRRTADLLSECGNFEKFCHILRIGGKYNFGARKASKIDVRKWLMEIQLKEQTGEKVEEQELKDCTSYLLTFLEKPDAQSLNADLMRTVFTAARVNHRNGLYEEAFKLLEKLESTLLLTGGRKDLLYGLMLFLVGQFKYMYGCGMTVDAENDLKQADAILEKHFGRNHVFAYCKKLLGSCALLNNNLGNASTNLVEASAFFEDLNSKHYEVADISFKLAQLQIEGNFEDAKEIQNAVQKAVEMLACSFGRISPKTGCACVQAGLILQKVDKGAAINEVNKAVEIYHSLGLQLDHPVINLCQRMTGLFQLCSGNKEEAEKYFVDALKESPETDESCHGLYHDNMCEVDNLVTEFSNGYFREKPLYRSAKMFSLVGLVAMKKGKDIRRKYLDVLVSLAEESDTEEHGIIDFAGHCCFVSHISCLAGPNAYFFIFPDPEGNSQSSNDDEVIISRSKNSSCILFWRTSCKIQEMKELRNLDFHICESVRALFLQPKFGKSYNKTNDFYLELPLQTLSLCAQIDCLPLLVEVKLGEPCKEHANSDNLTSSALEDSSPEPAVHVSYLSYEFSNKRTAELAFDYLAFSASKEPLLNDVKAVEVADGHSPYPNFAFFSSQHSRYSHFSVFVDKELPVLRVKCRHLSESKSNGFCCSVKSALENVMYFLCEDVRISFKPFVQLSCGVCSMVGFRGSLDVTCNCIVATKTESSVSSPQAEEAMFNTFARDCFTEKELDCSTKQVLNSVTCRHSTLFHHQGSSSEASTSNCSNESDQNPFSSSRTSLCGAKAQVLKSDFDKECHVSKLQNQEVCSGSRAAVYLRLLEYLLSDRNVTPEHETLNGVVPDRSVEERSFLSADFLSASPLNSVPVSPGSFCSCDPLPSVSSSPSGCISLCECSDVDLADSCLAKVQNKSETKETHRYAEICQLKSQLSEDKTPDNCNCDSIDGVLKQLESNVTCEEPFRESSECSDVQIGANCHSQCKNSLEEMELSATEGIGVRGSRNSGIDCFVLSKDEESATFQNNCFELQEQINKLQEKLRRAEAQKQQLKADLGRCLFLKGREKRSGKLLSAPRAFTGDENRCCGGITSSKCLSANGRLLCGTASLQDKPDFNFQARFIEISNSLSREEFQQMKILARGKVDGYRLAKMKVGFELLKEVERVSEHPCTDIGLLLKEIQRLDLVEKLGLPSPESKISESAGTSSASLPSRDDQGGERCTTLKSCTSTMGFDHVYDLSASASFNIDSENPVSINIEDNDPLSVESVGTNDKEGICVPVSSEQSGPSSGASSVCVNALRTAEGSRVCSRSSSQGSSKKSAKSPEVVLTSHSASAPGEIANESNLNTGSREEEGPGRAQVMNCTDDVTNGGNTEAENIKGQSVDSFYGASGTTPSDTKTFPLSVSEYDSQIDSSDSSFFCRSTDPVSSHVDDANPLQLQQSSNVHGQTTLRMHEPDESSSSSTDWERLGARPKISQRQRPRVAISPPPHPPIALSPWLCEHYQRHCRVRFPCCTQFYPCYRCHNSSRNCENEEAKACHATHLKCSFCEHEQEIDENSGVCGKCGAKVAAYLCSICKHFTNVDKNPYHCEKCGICRIHAGKSCQCEVCNVCLDKRLEGNHECCPDSSHNECYNCFEDVRSCLLNSVVPHIESIEEHSFPSSAFPSSSLNSLSVSLGDPFNQEEPCECSDEDLAAGCLAKAQSKPETKETHHYADVFQLKTELNEKENSDNCDSIDGVPKQLGSIVVSQEPLGESNECPDMQIGVNHNPQCQNSLEEMEVSAANDIGVRTPTNSGLDPFMLSKDEESATFQNNSFELLEQINELKEQLRQREAENQQLTAEVGRYLFLEDREKRSGKLLSVPSEIASDESISWRASASFKCGTTNGRHLGGAASLQDNPDFNLQARFIDISNSLSAEEFKQMKTLARGKVDGFRLAKMKVGFELFKEVERVSEHPCTDIGELLKGIQRCDLVEKLGLPYPESKTSVCAGTSSDSLPSRGERLEDLEQELDKERCATQMSCKSTLGFAHRSDVNSQKFTPDHDCDLYASVSFESDSEDPVSINIEDNDLLPKDKVRASVKEGIFVPNCRDRSGLLSGGSSISVSSSDSLALISAESTPVCSTSSSQGSFEKSAKAPELSLTTHSASARGEIVNESDLGLNTGNSEERERESNECPDMQIKVQHHPQRQNSLEEMEVSAANGIGVRTPTNSGLDPFMLSKEEESATFQNNCFELLKQINELKEQLRQREAENQQLKAEVGRYLFLEDREKRSGKLLSVPRVSASDDSKSCGASASSKCVTTNGRHLGGAESAGTSTDCVPSRDERLQDLEPEQGEERCANHMSINMKDNDPLSMESVGTNAKESICVPNSPNKSGPSSDCSSISVSSSDSLVLSTAKGTSVSSSSSSQGSSEKSAKALEVALTTHSAAARCEIASESNLDTGSSEEEVPALAQLLNSTNDLTDGGNIEVGDIEGQSVDLCYGASGTSRSDTRSPLSECDLQISSSDSYALCPLADPENLHVGDGNLLHLQQSSNAHGQTTLGMHGSDVASSSSTGWECLGARPKSSQTQRPLVDISPPSPPLIVSPISDGLAGDFLVRHSQDKALHESLFSNGRDFSFLGNDTSQGVSFVEGSTNASEAYRVRPCFGACQVAVGNNSYVRSDGNAFSHVPSGDFERARLLAGISYNESLYGISPPTAAAPLTIPTGPSNVTMGWNGSSRDGANNGDGFLNTDHRVTGQRDYSRESYFPYVQHNTHVGQVPIHWQSNANSRITSSGFAYGLTSSGFTFGPLGSGGFAGVRPRQSLHANQRHVVSDCDSVFIDEQSANEMSHDVDLALGRQSLANRNHELPTSAGRAVIVDNCGLPLPLSVSAYSINSTRGISATTSHPLVVSASNGTRGLDNNASRNSVVSSATPVDENAETSLAPVSVNVNENNSRGALLNRDNGTNYIEPIADSLLALERRVADASALDERMLIEREEREQFAQEIERRERMIRERRERERREREEREIQEVEEQEQEIPDGVRWLQELEDTSFGTPMAL
ncbi:serine-rich adhesin for platelets-like isoform X2 [Montipora foliosa]|uniref:serine-rich adhesin for platelets-like isoform X2 n=1 Tax=Montipora foliosa TaxID=591990 RepID=UPI0035F10B9C